MLQLPTPKPSVLIEWNDIDLIKAIQSRSISACQNEVTELYKRHARDVLRMTRSLYDGTDEGIKAAEDLFQDAWRKALERINRYDLDSTNSFAAWVKGIADNLFLEEHRWQVKRARVIGELSKIPESEDPAEESVNDSDQEDIEVISESGIINRTKLRASLEILSDKERDILIEWYKTYDKDDPGNSAHAQALGSLSAKYGIQKESIRKIKQRAVQKIQTFLRL